MSASFKKKLLALFRVNVVMSGLRNWVKWVTLSGQHPVEGKVQVGGSGQWPIERVWGEKRSAELAISEVEGKCQK